MFRNKHLKRRSLIVNQNLVAKLQIVSQMRSVDKDSALLGIPSQMHLLPLMHHSIVYISTKVFS